MSLHQLPEPWLVRVLAEIVTEPGLSMHRIRRELGSKSSPVITAIGRLQALGLVAINRKGGHGYRPTAAGRRAMEARLRRGAPLVPPPRVRFESASSCEWCRGPAPGDVPVCRRCEEGP